MEKREFALSLIDAIKNNEQDRLYKFFTSKTVFVFLNDNKEMDLSSFISFLKENMCGKDIILGRVLESRVCIKIELKIENLDIEAFLIDIEKGRIRRLEIM